MDQSDQDIGTGTASPTDGAVATKRDPVLWRIQATDCGAPINPALRQRMRPTEVWDVLDRHLQPAGSTNSAIASAECCHVVVGLRRLESEYPDLFGFPELGSRAPAYLWRAQEVLAEALFDSCLHVEIHVDHANQIQLATTGAGVTGVLPVEVWHAVATLLTTCTATVYEPDSEAGQRRQSLWDHARQVFPEALRRRAMPEGTPRPRAHRVGPGAKTWWSYSTGVSCAGNFVCTGHRHDPVEADCQHFGPGSGQRR